MSNDSGTADNVPPLGTWDSDRFWYADPTSVMTPDEQKAQNESNGYTCNVRSSTSAGSFSG